MKRSDLTPACSTLHYLVVKRLLFPSFWSLALQPGVNTRVFCSFLHGLALFEQCAGPEAGRGRGGYVLLFLFLFFSLLCSLKIMDMWWQQHKYNAENRKSILAPDTGLTGILYEILSSTIRTMQGTFILPPLVAQCGASQKSSRHDTMRYVTLVQCVLVQWYKCSCVSPDTPSRWEKWKTRLVGHSKVIVLEGVRQRTFTCFSVSCYAVMWRVGSHYFPPAVWKAVLQGKSYAFRC